MRRPTRSFVALVALASHLWTLIAPTVAYAQDAAEAEPAAMVPLGEYERIGGGSLSTAGDRSSAATGDGADDGSPRASIGGGFEEVEGEDVDGQSDEDGGVAREGEDEGAPAESEVPAQDATTTLALPGGEDKTGVTAQTISIPKGAGSIQGMEESFSAQLSTGIATFSVPFALMKGRGGAQASLGLSYSSAGGTGPAGQGWSVGVPFIARQTDRGIPKYNETDEWSADQDHFVFNGGQELVPICTIQGRSCPGALSEARAGDGKAEVMPEWANGYQYFRPRVEGSFLRFFWAPDHKSWIVQDKSGTIMELGKVGAYGPAPGGIHLNDDAALERNPSRDSEIYKWHLTRQYDQHVDASTGQVPLNVVAYGYDQFSSGQAYLTDIYDTSPVADPTSTAKSAFAHHTVLRWENRPDTTESYRSGWLISSTKRLVGVDVASKPFMGGSGASRRQVRRYHLSYDQSLHRSVLKSVQVEGRCGGSENAEATPSESSEHLPAQTGCGRLPAMTFEYSAVEGYQPDGEPSSDSIPGYMAFDGRVNSLPGSPDHSIDEALTDFFDINSDGLPDVLVTAPGLYSNGHAVFFNGEQGVAGFGDFTNIGIVGVNGANAGTITLNNLNISPQDVDGDGRINLVHMPAFKEYSIYDPRKVDGGWKWVGRKIETASGQNVKINLGQDAQNTQIADVNFDGLVDVVVSTGTEFQTFFSLGRYTNGDGQFGWAEWTGKNQAALHNDPVTSCVPHSGLPVQFSDGETKLGDMNGDGISDIVRIRRGDIKYWPGRGNGFWGTGERDDCDAGTFGANRHKAMDEAPNYSDINGSTVRLNDLNGDGLDDLIQIRYDAVDIWLNVDGQGWTEKLTLDGTPFHAGFHNRVRIMDVNGSSTPDILYGDANDYKYIDLQGGEKPYILTKVENGLGKSTSLEYSTSSSEMMAVAGGNPEGEVWQRPWTSKMPTVTHVVKRVTERDNITIRGRPPAEYVTEYSYRDPVYEGRQREFRGFSRAKATRIGDANSPTDVSESVFLLGECLETDVSQPEEVRGTPWDGESQTHACAPPKRWRDNPYEALKGLPVETHKMDAAGGHLATTENEYTIRTLYEGLDGRAVRHAFLSKTDSLLYDTGAGASSRAGIQRRGFIDQGISGAGQTMPYNPQAEASAPSSYGAGMAHLRTSSDVDLYGNKLEAVNSGCVGGSACPQNHGLPSDEVITQVTEPVLITEHAGGWMWRTNHSWVSGTLNVTHSAPRNETLTDYDAFGRPKAVRAVLAGSEAIESHRHNADTAPDAGFAADGTFVQSRTEYDQFGNAIRTRAVNGRCAQVTYDDADDSGYGLFAMSESISIVGSTFAHLESEPAPNQSCASDSGMLTTTAAYDHGIGTVTLAMDLNDRNTKAVYDEFGRIIALHKPSAYKDGTSGVATYQTHPSVSIQYFLPTDLGGTKHSIIYTETQDGTDEDDAVRQIKSYAYVDGFGRTLVTLSEADPSIGPGQGNDGGAWIAGSLLEWDQKSAVSKKFMPFFWDGDPMSFNYGSQPTTPYGRQRYDAFGRQVQTFDLDGTITLQSRYHALSTDLWDAADLTPGQHQGSYASERKDGHGRTLQTTERFRDGGAMEERHIRTTYLPSGEPISIERVSGNRQPVIRWMRYDTLGRMVLNVEPNTTTGFVSDPYTPATASIQAWRYQYNLFGDLVATSDARGCGQNFFYDSAGRIVGEDYAPCSDLQEDYTDADPNDDGVPDATSLEVAYFYDDASKMPSGFQDEAPDGWVAASTPSTGFTRGRAIAVFDRGSASFTTFDGRGRTVFTHTRVATPTVYAVDANSPFERPQPKGLSARYATRVYTRERRYDAADREVAASTGAAELKDSLGNQHVPELLNEHGVSECTTEYSERGSVKKAGSSYGSLVSSITRTADNLVNEIVYGDAAQTRTAYLYDERRRISSVQTYRGPPSSGAWDASNPNSSSTSVDEPTRQLVLQDEDFLYDVVGNPVEIRDWRDAQDWPDGAKPVTKKIEYDDLYRATRIKYEYSAGDDEWKSPFQAEIEADPAQSDPRRAQPSPHVQFQKRILQQTFEYDWVGNNEKTTDDANGFYDRSLGDITNDQAGGKPYQLKRAEIGNDDWLEARYDEAGNMVDMVLERSGTCLGGASDACDQRFLYDWDEVGRLTRARRWDANNSGIGTEAPAGTPQADLRYYYDASDQRVIKEAHDPNSSPTSSFTLYIFESLELRRTDYANTQADDGIGADYEVSQYTVVPYLLANGVRLARLVYHASGEVPEEDYDGAGAPGDVNGPQASNGEQHVFFELGDHLGSTSVVLDKATGELVERATFQGYGGAESDYRPERWKSFREDYRFTGKEEDVEVGLQYFGKRYLNPLLGRWISADPLEIHAPGSADLNVYAYVKGAILKSIDPLGLKDKSPASGDKGTNEDGSEGGGTNGGGDAAAAPESTSDNSSNCLGDGCGGASAVDSGTAHEGAPSKGKVKPEVGDTSKGTAVGAGVLMCAMGPAACGLGFLISGVLDAQQDSPVRTPQEAKAAQDAAVSANFLVGVGAGTLGAFRGVFKSGGAGRAAPEVAPKSNQKLQGQVKSSNSQIAELEAEANQILTALGVDDLPPVTAVGYHASPSANTESILEGGLRAAVQGRLGGGGPYVNSSAQGAAAEAAYWNPGQSLSIFKVTFSPKDNLRLPTPPRVHSVSVPGTSGAGSISAESVRAPGTTNTIILNNTAKVRGVVK